MTKTRDVRRVSWVTDRLLDPALPSGHDGRGLGISAPMYAECTPGRRGPRRRQRHAEGTVRGKKGCDQPKETLGNLAFQAGHAGSIPVTRSTHNRRSSSLSGLWRRSGGLFALRAADVVGYEITHSPLVSSRSTRACWRPRCSSPASCTPWGPEEGVGTARTNHQTCCSCCRLQSTARELP